MAKMICAVALCLMMNACSGIKIERLTDAAPLPVPEGVKPHVIGLSNIKIMIPRGVNTTGFGPKGFDGALACDFPWGPVQGVSVKTLTDKTHILEVLSNTLEPLGYDVAGNPGLLFNEDEDYMRVRYRIGARITNMALDLCAHDDSVFPTLYREKGLKGEGNLTIDWVVYDGLKKKVIYKTTTKGYAKLASAIPDGASILLEDVFASAIYALGTDPQFHALIFEGIDPVMDDAILGVDAEQLPPEDWGEPLIAAPAKAFGKDILKMQRSAVLVESGAGGHGSGFFIADDLIMTNAHVVGFADTLRVTLSGKSQSYLARLVRTDRPRDIAVLRLVDQPPRRLYDIAPIIARDDLPQAGDDIYVVGAPYYKKLQDTVTKGMISGIRYDNQLRQNYIQADAMVYAGNSGGPMYNIHGQVVGLSVLGFIKDDGNELPGLNWFIPIHDAMDKLDIKTRM